MLTSALRLIVPSVWLGLIVGLGFIETPLKFLAPGVTVEIALGIGRLVLTTLDGIGVALMVVITVLSLLRTRLPRAGLVTVGALWLVLLVQVALIRPPLNARTDAILAGRDPGESSLHVVYIAADLLLIAGIIVYLVIAGRQRAAAGGIEAAARP